MDVSNITVNAQNSICIDFGKKIYIDPFKIESGANDADYIFLTHDHYDHFSLEDLNKVGKMESIFVVPEAMDKKVRKNTAFGKNFPVKPGECYETEDFTFETIPMYNKIKPFHPKRSGWCGYVLNLDGTRVYIAGDIDAIKEAAEVKCDIALIPIGGTYTMDPKEAAGLINKMRPKIVVPVHYGDIVGKKSYGDDFAKLVDDGIEIVRLLSV